MALTELQVANVRRYAGYQLAGTPALTGSTDIVYLVYGARQMSLVARLESLSPSEESLLATYLDQLDTLEEAIISSSDNLDTDKAAVWTHNKNEVDDRMKLFNIWRKRMCEYLGLFPGPGLGGGGIRLFRS